MENQKIEIRKAKMETNSRLSSVLISPNGQFLKNIKTYIAKELNILVMYVFIIFGNCLLGEIKIEQTLGRWLNFIHKTLNVNYHSTDGLNVTQGRACVPPASRAPKSNNNMGPDVTDSSSEDAIDTNNKAP